MKYLSLLAAIFLLISCTCNSNCHKKNKIQIVKNYYHALNSGDTNNVESFISDSFAKINNDKLFEGKGVDLFITSVENHKRDNKEYQFIVDDIFDNVDKVCVRWTWKSINIKSGEEKKVKSQGISIFEIKNGKIYKLWQSFDLLGFKKQLSINS